MRKDDNFAMRDTGTRDGARVATSGKTRPQSCEVMAGVVPAALASQVWNVQLSKGRWWDGMGWDGMGLTSMMTGCLCGFIEGFV